MRLSEVRLGLVWCALIQRCDSAFHVIGLTLEMLSILINMVQVFFNR